MRLYTPGPNEPLRPSTPTADPKEWKLRNAYDVIKHHWLGYPIYRSDANNLLCRVLGISSTEAADVLDNLVAGDFLTEENV